jgi:predicted nucleic acid-binding protein
MSEYTQWLESNERYLGNALNGLRARLERLVNDDGTPKPRAAPAMASSPSLLSRWFRDAPRTPPHPGDSVAASDVSPVPEAPVSVPALPATDSEPRHRAALELLSERLGLSSFERDTLLLCAAMELDTRVASLCARAQQDASRPYPTFALAMSLFDEPAWDALSPERPLRFWRLIEINQPGAQPLVAAALRADERIVNYLKGLNYLDDRLATLLTPLPSPRGTSLPPSQQAVAAALRDRLRTSPRSEGLPVVQLLGSDGASKQAVAQMVAESLGVQPYRIGGDMLPPSTAEQEHLIRLWQRECLLVPLALYVDLSEHDGNDAHGALRRFLARVGGLTFVDAHEPLPHANAISIDVAKPTVDEQRQAWRGALGDAAGDHPERLAGHFDFGTGKVRQVAEAAVNLAHEGSQPLADALWQGALARARPALDRLARRIDPVAGWADIQLPPQELELLRLIADQVALRTTVYDDWGFRERMNRGLGISALFAGESGTGKTMAAEVLASELGLLLYRIDLSAVVSKYIGETEKNLRRLFDAAEDGGAILFFDEADALFGRRSEVKDSHDRYANIEINYLLQRMESYRGLAILATNMKSALDSAFMRRLRFIVNFPFPGPAQRRAIWARAFPPRTQVGVLDLDRLAKLALSGGSIQNIAVNAAFMAARSGGTVTMPVVLEAARAEFRKLEKPVNEADFRWLDTVGGAS